MLIPALTTYEHHLALCYFANAASHLRHTSMEAERLFDWFAKCADLLGMIQPPRHPVHPFKQEWQDLLKFLEDKRAATKNAPEDTMAQRIRHLGKAIGLHPVDVDILNFMLRCQTQPIIGTMIARVFFHSYTYLAYSKPLDEMQRALLCVFDKRLPSTILSRFKPDAPLLRSGLLSIDHNGDVDLMDRLYRLAVPLGEANLDPTSLLLDAPTPGELEWSDFDHLAQDRDHVERLLSNALRSGDSGVNVLLYGPPGTDKTEFCKVLANRLGATLYSIGKADEDVNVLLYGHPKASKEVPIPRERLNELWLAQRLVGHDRKSLLLFDETDALPSDSRSDGFGFFLGFSPGHQHGDAKMFMNRLLEQNAAPTLWIMNHTHRIDPAILRRMMFAMELRLPPPKVVG